MKTFKNTVPAWCGVILVLLFCFTVLCGCTAEDGDNKFRYLEKIEVEDKEGLDKKTELQIRQDFLYEYLDLMHYVYYEGIAYYSMDNIKVERYLGTYNGYVAVMMSRSWGNLAVVSAIKVADTIFVFTDDTPRIFIWKKVDDVNREEFYKRRDAYWEQKVTPYPDESVYKLLRDAHDLGMLPFYELRDAYDLGMVTADDVRSIAERYYEPYKGIDFFESRSGSAIDRRPTIFSPEELEQMER